MIVAIATISMLPTRASAMPPFSPKRAEDLVKKSRSMLLSPFDEDGAEHEGEDGGRRTSALSSATHRDELLGQPAPAEVVRPHGDVVGIDELRGAHPVDILRAFWNLFTISWADTFVISEITSRIAPR